MISTVGNFYLLYVVVSILFCFFYYLMSKKIPFKYFVQFSGLITFIILAKLTMIYFSKGTELSIYILLILAPWWPVLFLFLFRKRAK
jgi:Ca2+/Na+ antiporter